MLKDVLKESREKLQLKQSDVAEYVGVTAQTYMKWENGKNEPKASDIKKLAQILRISENEICRGATYEFYNEPLIFMKELAVLKNALDDVTFTSVLFQHVEDKKGLIESLNSELTTSHEAMSLRAEIEGMEEHYLSEGNQKAAQSEMAFEEEAERLRSK